VFATDLVTPTSATDLAPLTLRLSLPGVAAACGRTFEQVVRTSGQTGTSFRRRVKEYGRPIIRNRDRLV